MTKAPEPGTSNISNEERCITPKLVAALDRCELSMRDSVFILEATIDALGCNIDEFSGKSMSPKHLAERAACCELAPGGKSCSYATVYVADFQWNRVPSLSFANSNLQNTFEIQVLNCVLKDTERVSFSSILNYHHKNCSLSIWKSSKIAIHCIFQCIRPLAVFRTGVGGARLVPQNLFDLHPIAKPITNLN
ncbi:hypothetical protein AVEN_161570-1 [Araneus ventricosus]|uniref:Uncharacterized protein n=1 Tax=Araneus ventricosus TaxID=182803 RepID=A0A4Y2FIK8_ARAVE|nr:hypothetical protein AVEN_161570-1 [Araneus ventricosus]